MNTKFTDEQLVAILSWLEAKREDGYNLDDIIIELTHGPAAVKSLTE